MDPTAVSVAAVRDVGPNAVAIDFETPAGFDARPGQFVRLSAEIDGETVSRFYTISSPDVADTFEVTLTVDPDGAFGTHVTTLEPGDSLLLAGPFGDAHYEGEAETVVLAGGPGIGPAVGIAERTLGDGGRATVVYRDDDPIHEGRLAELAKGGARVYVLSADEGLDAALAEALDAIEGDHRTFVYGFAPFVEAATEAIVGAGGDAAAAKVESFGPAPGTE
ncbi:FAD-dependent oxidoreductase [Halomarina halobia]|uniref:FAD-dependent oxidoreductase n=1 Tax=Halomarina halobia TaxID=3033386 RepID=A0ABD6ABN1_9EURY|nr:FAD-dependent oxidoreductase [Halomarina sp. PSR21]